MKPLEEILKINAEVVPELDRPTESPEDIRFAPERFHASFSKSRRQWTLHDVHTGFSYPFTINGGVDTQLKPDNSLVGRLMFNLDLKDHPGWPDKDLLLHGEAVLVKRTF